MKPPNLHEMVVAIAIGTRKSFYKESIKFSQNVGNVCFLTLLRFTEFCKLKKTQRKLEMEKACMQI